MAAIFFDWIFVAIVWPWPILALWGAFARRAPLPEERVDRTMAVRRAEVEASGRPV